jgi:hypothetical protein
MNEPRPAASPSLRPPATVTPQRPAPAQPLHSQPASHLPKVGALPTQPNRADEVELDPIGLVDEVASDAEEKKIKAFGIIGAHRAREWKRKTTVTGHGAIRVRSFHGKLSDQGMQYIDEAINDWLDAHPDIEIKFVTSTVGQFEGKIREPALVLNLWY